MNLEKEGKALVIQHSFKIFLAFTLFRPNFQGLYIFFLQFLQRKSYARNASISEQKLQPVKNLGIFSSKIFFLVLTFLKRVQQSITSYIGYALRIINQEVVLKNLLSLGNLMRAQVFCIHKFSRVIIVGKHKNFMLTIS